jgi:hypothetical protein
VWRGGEVDDGGGGVRWPATAEAPTGAVGAGRAGEGARRGVGGGAAARAWVLELLYRSGELVVGLTAPMEEEGKGKGGDI